MSRSRCDCQMRVENRTPPATNNAISMVIRFPSGRPASPMLPQTRRGQHHHLPAGVRDGARRHSVEAVERALQIRSLDRLAEDHEPRQPRLGATSREPLVTMDEIETFLDECRAPKWSIGSKAC